VSHGEECERAYCLSEWVEVHAVEFEEVIAGEWSSRCHLDSGWAGYNVLCIAGQVVENMFSGPPHSAPPHSAHADLMI
jgi:hypothetical protein